MDAVAGQEKLDVAQDALEERLRLLARERHFAEQWRGVARRADVLHQHAVADLREGQRHVGARLIEQALRGELVGDP